ncbi:hypothetical protein Tco_0194910 [Tanacetum coccineum]
MEEIDLFLATNDSMPSGIEDDDYDSEGDIRFLEELLNNDSLPLPKNESSNLDHFYDLSPSCPPLEPPDVEICFDFKPDTGVVINKVVGDISEHDVLMPNLLPTRPTLCLVFDLLLPFSSENEDKVFNPGMFRHGSSFRQMFPEYKNKRSVGCALRGENTENRKLNTKNQEYTVSFGRTGYVVWTTKINTLYLGRKFDMSYLTGGYAVSGGLPEQSTLKTIK